MNNSLNFLQSTSKATHCLADVSTGQSVHLLNQMLEFSIFLIKDINKREINILSLQVLVVVVILCFYMTIKFRTEESHFMHIKLFLNVEVFILNFFN